MTSESLREPARRHDRLDAEWFQLFAIDGIVDELRSEPAYRANDQNGITLLKTDRLSVVLEIARRGHRIDRHTIDGPTFIQVLAGSLEIACHDETRNAHAGEMVVIPHDRPRMLRAEEDAVFLWAFAVDRTES